MARLMLRERMRYTEEMYRWETIVIAAKEVRSSLSCAHATNTPFLQRAQLVLYSKLDGTLCSQVLSSPDQP